MKIFSAAQIRHCDEQTISELGIPSHELMENAARACLRWILNRFSRQQSFVIVCGMGNNGGDGLALTRLLIREGYPASALVLRHAEQFSPDASLNLKRLHHLAPECIAILNESDDFIGISDDVVIIDAVFGTGINRPIQGWVGDFIKMMNSLTNQKVAIDMPSGLPADTLPDNGYPVFTVDDTLSFQFLKRSLLHPEGVAFAGLVRVLDIGLSAHFISATPSIYRLVDEPLIRSLYRPRPTDGHKGTFGNAVLAGGSYGMVGAIALATRAALRVGTGKVYVQAPACGYQVLQALCPEAMFQRAGEDFIEKIRLPEKGAVGIGPGMGQAALTKRSLAYVLRQSQQPLVLDADALNIIASNKEELIDHIPAGSVLTPHPGEFQRLFGPSVNSMEMVEKGRNMAMKLNVVIVLKGHHTNILPPNGSCFYNATGNSGLSKGGSGDVLTGMITGLMAQGYNAEEAAIMGVWLHGTAADFAAREKSMEAMTANDVIDYLGRAFEKAQGRP
ncbi:MAG TPA: NAD(P)H-hydrate dehydratase [Edaphocola sp.]|nr:NAD(P)H-hydrate dehydratase [Edaphocola sp.]